MITLIDNGAIAETESEIYTDLTIYEDGCIIFCIDTKNSFKFQGGSISVLQNAVTLLEKKVQLVFGEVLTGAVDGSNATFTTTGNFDPSLLRVFANGIRQGLISDYNTSGTQTIQFTVSPERGEILTADY